MGCGTQASGGVTVKQSKWVTPPMLWLLRGPEDSGPRARGLPATVLFPRTVEQAPEPSIPAGLAGGGQSVPSHGLALPTPQPDSPRALHTELGPHQSLILHMGA